MRTPRDRDESGHPSASASRRKFIKGAVAVTATMGVTTMVTGCSEDDGENAGSGGACDTGSQITWDRETDVIVVGSGTGLAAALASAVSGSETLVLEKWESIGGSTKMSGGVLWIPNNPVMVRDGIEDSRENAMTYVKMVAQGQADDEIIEAFVDKGPEMVSFIEEHADFNWRSSVLLTDYHPEWPGSVFQGRNLEPDLSGSSITLGPKLVQGLADAVEKAGGEILLETPVKRLVTRLNSDGTQEVLGVVAESEGADIAIKARRGVVLAAGGYDWNFEMKKHFLRGPSRYTIGHPGNTGDGIQMAMLAGADLRNMNECWGAVVYKEETEAAHANGDPAVLTTMAQRRMPGCITVNRYGKRFGNEAGDYDSSWRSFFAWENWGETTDHNLPAYQISDKSVEPSSEMGVVEADTIRELAEKLGIDPDALEATVEEFNQFCEDGEDPHFHRGESAYDTHYGKTLGTLEDPPFYGIEVAPADLGTCGGARINANAQVLNPMGQVISRLYAAGNNAGVGGPGAGYGGGGGTIGPGLTFSYIAGMHVAGLGKQGESDTESEEG